MSTAKRIPQAQTPVLESGDRLSRAEFERRYRALPHIKAELIEGVVYMASPVRARKHGQPHSNVIGWLVTCRGHARRDGL